MNFYQVQGYNNLKWPLLVLGIIHFFTFGNISLIVGPLCTGLISVRVSFVGIGIDGQFHLALALS